MGRLCEFATSLCLLGCATNRPPANLQQVQPAPGVTVAASRPAPTKDEPSVLCVEENSHAQAPDPRTPLAQGACWSKRGQAYLDAAQPAVHAAQQAFELCLKLTPNDAECHYGLARALDWQEEPDAALDHYFAALHRDTGVAKYYLSPAELCMIYKLYDTAIGLVDAGFARVQSGGPDTYSLWNLRLQVAQSRGDEAGMLTALEGAYAAGDDSHPEDLFYLGATYGVAIPPRIEAASALLHEFVHQVCRGAKASRHKEQCETSQALLQKWAREYPKVKESKLPAISPPPKPSVPPPLPPAPTVPLLPLRNGDAYTVWGASLRLRNQRRHPEMNGADLSITGVISRSNVPDAPRCAVHPPDIADPDDCKALVPTFWLCDTLDAPSSDCIRVMGWASNYANIWAAIEESRKPNPQPYVDNFWGQEIPQPIPQRGARVTVSGRYGFLFTRASTGAEADPIMGILTYKKLQWIDPPRANPKLPGMP